MKSFNYWKREENASIFVNMQETNTAPKKRKRKVIKRKIRKKIHILRTILTVILIGYLCIGVSGTIFITGLLKDMPEMEVTDFISKESTRIYDANGTIIEEVGTYLRDNITYDQCPESLVDAFLSIEDSRFFSHNGFDIPRFMKAALSNLASGSLGSGGSTFTMQLVKNTYFTVENGDDSTTYTKSLQYKAQQIALSMEAETILTKQEIFELYANKINFGKNIRGVQRAAQYYFGKNVSELTLAESAMLAGIVNLPNVYNPYSYLDYATTRRNQVLDMMAYHGYITEEEAELAKAIDVEDLLVGENYAVKDGSKYQSYVDAVLEEAQEKTGLDPTLGGMQIYTAMDPVIQDEIEAIQDEETEIWFADDLMQTAIVTMDNTNGEIVGIGGGRYYSGARSLNRATAGYKQPGSSVKPFLSYALAFEYLGYTTDEILLDKPITMPGESMVLVNATGTYQGDVTIKDAVAYSLNIPAILTMEDVVAKIGSSGVVDYLQSMGFDKVTDDNFELRFAIGGNNFTTTAVELAGAHGAMINGGVYNEPHTIRSIQFTDGSEYTPEIQNVRVLSSGSAYLVAQLMQNNVDSQCGNYMDLLKRDYPVYAKTGTTDWGDSGLSYGIPEGAAKDKWMISSTSKYTNAVWVGWDKAVAYEGTYFSNWKSYLNIPGNINRLLLDTEETTTSAENLNGVERPSDVQDITYVYGTYPHVEADDSISSSRLITSMVSSTGLTNQPLVSIDEYTSGVPSLNSISASISGSILYLNWVTQKDTCVNGYRDISLHDEYNNITKYGTCLVNNSWLYYSSSNVYYADIYIGGSYYGTITSKSSSWIGALAYSDEEVAVCGSIRNYYGYSETACRVVGYMEDPYAAEEEEVPEESTEEVTEEVTEETSEEASE